MGSSEILIGESKITDIADIVKRFFNISFPSYRLDVIDEFNRRENFILTEKVIVVGSSAMVAMFEINHDLIMALRGNGLSEESYRLLASKSPNDIDMVASPYTWLALAGKLSRNESCRIDTSINYDNLRIVFIGEKGNELIEIYPSWVSFSNKENDLVGKEWDFDIVKRGSLEYKGLRFMHPLHALTDKIIRYREKDIPYIGAMQELLCAIDKDKYQWLANLNLSSSKGRMAFVNHMNSQEKLFKKASFIDRDKIRETIAVYLRKKNLIKLFYSITSEAISFIQKRFSIHDENLTLLNSRN